MFSTHILPIQANIEFNPGTQADGVLPHTAGTDPGSAFGSFFGVLLTAVLTIAALLLFIYLIWGGFEWLTSGGDKGKVESARQRITQGVIGMIVLASAVALMMVVQGLLGVELLNFSPSSSGSSGSGSSSTTNPVCSDGSAPPC